MVGGGGRRPRCTGSSLKVGREVGETWAGMGDEGKKKFPKKKIPTWVEERVKKKVNLSWPPWLAQGQGETKKVHP